MSYRATVTGDLTLKEGVTKEQIEEIIKKGCEVFDEVETYNQGNDTLISIYECQENYWEEDCKDFYKAVSKYLKDGELSFRGEDNEVWKHTFDGERWQEYTGKILYTNPTVIASEESTTDDEQEYIVPFAYERYGHLTVRAKSPAAALDIAEDNLKKMSAKELDANSEYLSDSEEIDREGVLRYGDGSIVPDIYDLLG